jgi:hypothetical protein
MTASDAPLGAGVAELPPSEEPAPPPPDPTPPAPESDVPRETPPIAAGAGPQPIDLDAPELSARADTGDPAADPKLDPAQYAHLVDPTKIVGWLRPLFHQLGAGLIADGIVGTAGPQVLEGWDFFLNEVWTPSATRALERRRQALLQALADSGVTPEEMDDYVALTPPLTIGAGRFYLWLKKRREAKKGVIHAPSMPPVQAAPEPAPATETTPTGPFDPTPPNGAALARRAAPQLEDDEPGSLGGRRE